VRRLRIPRLGVRLLAFNVVLVFFPIAGVLFLGQYEDALEAGEIRDLTNRARIIAATVSHEGHLSEQTFEELVRRARIDDMRVRLIDARGVVVADSRQIVSPLPEAPARTDRRHFLYRVGATSLKVARRITGTDDPPLPEDVYAEGGRLQGEEISAVLRGREVFDKRIAGGRSVVLYRMVPVVVGGWTIGAVVASGSTWEILQELYVIRLRVMRVLAASLAVAVLVSLFFATSIAVPLRKLRLEARAVLDRRRGGPTPRFRTSARRDEIGELSRALERIMRRLDRHVAFVESFAADVVHELKNPLASIRNAAALIGDGNQEDLRRFLPVIEQEVARMERMLSGIREISSVDAGIGREPRQTVDLARLLRRIVDGFRVRAGESVKFVLDTSERLDVLASEDRLLQVFENLLDNAVSFSPPGGRVRVHAARDGGMVAVSIEDQGGGIAEGDLERVFDRFFTHRSGSAAGEGHTGLGLSIARAIVTAYGGSIRAANQEEGALFTVRLPAAREA
jgi:two-component system sensor histidine kinase ChvG